MGLETLSSLSSGATGQFSSQETLLEFRAGRMLLHGTRVQAEPRKGLIRIVKADDSLLHFQWWDRISNVMEEDQIIFPDEALFQKVPESSGRVYILKFKHDDRKFFYWMQGPRPEEDEQLSNYVMYHLNQPLEIERGEEGEESIPQATSDASEGGETTEATSRDIIGAGIVSEAYPSGTGAVQLADLQRILLGLGQSLPQAFPDSSDDLQRDTGPSFSEILKPDAILPLLYLLLETSNLEERLSPFLPEGVTSPEAISELMQSPQFQQQLEMFTHVLRSGNLDWSQFGIDPSKYNFTVTSFLEAIEDQATSVLDSDSQTMGSQAENMVESELVREGQLRSQKDLDHDIMEEGL